MPLRKGEYWPGRVFLSIKCLYPRVYVDNLWIRVRIKLEEDGRVNGQSDGGDAITHISSKAFGAESFLDTMADGKSKLIFIPQYGLICEPGGRYCSSIKKAEVHDGRAIRKSCGSEGPVGQNGTNANWQIY